MQTFSEYFFGIDPTAAGVAYNWAVLDTQGGLVSLKGGDLDALLAEIDSVDNCLAAVNGPPRPNLGLLRRKLTEEQPAVHLRGADMRLAEYLLRERGISVPPTSGRTEACAAWTQTAFEIHRCLSERNFVVFPHEGSPRQHLETNAHAVFCVLLGQIPLPRPTLEGRIQRQLALYEWGLGIMDPMEFFEEITRHKLLRGVLPTELLYTAEQLDALAAAFTAWSVFARPDSRLLVGDREEGQIILPVAVLKDSYR
jgi:hypothetical protein